MTNILGSLWIKGHQLKSGYFLQAWGDMGKAGAGSWWTHAQRKVWLEQHLVYSNPGVLGQVLFEGVEKAGGQEEKDIVIIGPINGASNGESLAATKNGTENGCTGEAQVYNWDTIADKTRLYLFR